MKLRNKILIVVITAWLIFLAFTLIQSKYFLLQSFLELETAHANEDLERVDQAFNQLNYAPLDHALIDKIMDTTKVKLRLFLPYQIAASEKMQEIYKIISANKNGHFSEPFNENYLNGYTIIRDVNHQPIGFLQMTTPRPIYLTGLKAIKYYLLSFTVIGLLIALLLMKLIQELIIKRLEQLDSVLTAIRTNKDIKKRTDITHHDELSSVSTEINHLLDMIQASQEDLENRVNARTNELKHANIQLQKEIADRKLIEKELVVHKEHLMQIAHYDSLTSLPNRVYFNELLNKAIKQAEHHKKSLAILFIDLDRFKNINDALGHTAGDHVLKEIALRFSSSIRKDDVLARLSGDEFIVLLSGIENKEAILSLAEKLLKACTLPINVQHHEIYLCASIGISLYPKDGDSLEQLQKNADLAMYYAKKNGGTHYEFYSEKMDRDAKEHIRLEADLRKAIQSNQFILHFQPQINLHDETIRRVEALVRWQHPEVGMINPDKFIELAEETGLIINIGEWVLHEACYQAKKWHDMGYQDIQVTVNLSGRQFKHQDIFNLIKEILMKTGLPAHSLELEITESTMMENIEEAASKLNSIHDLGVQLSIDDFGTGYTSISYLRQLPINVIKIDKTFIKGLPSNQNDATITTSILLLAHQMGMQVVAEGVENAEQYNYLCEIGCDYIQGYLISPPQPADNVVTYFERKTEEQAT